MSLDKTLQGKISVLIADDEPLARSLLKTYLDQSPRFKVVAEAGDGADAVKKLQKLQPQVVFLDIQMPELNGFEVLEALNGTINPVVVFITSYDQYAVAAFEKNAADYILKPFTAQRLNSTLQKLEAAFTLEAARRSLDDLKQIIETYQQTTAGKTVADKPFLTRIMIKTPQRIIFIETVQVLFFEAEGDYVAAHMADKKYLVNYKMQQLEDSLSPVHFVRIHRSVIVNIAAITAFIPHFNGEYYVQLHNGKQLKTSRSYRNQLRQTFGEHL